MTSSRRTMRVLAMTVALGAGVLTGCSSNDGTSGEGASTTATVPEQKPAPAATVKTLESSLTDAPGCDVLDPSQCLFPFPSGHFETPDKTTKTGVRLALTEDLLPVNSSGTKTDPSAFNDNDGWSVGSPIMVTVRDVDLDASGWASESDLAKSVEDESGSVLVDLKTGERIPHWAEIDERPEVADDQRTTVLIRPAVLLPEGHRVAVALRTPKDTSGTEISPSPGFTVYRDNLKTDIEEIEARRPAMEKMFAALADAGVERKDLYLAWDFQVISTENLTGDLLTMRDLAFEELGDAAPTYEVTEVLTKTDDGDPLPDGVAKRIRGTYEVPSFLTGDGAPGTEMNRDGDGTPSINGTYKAVFTCSLTTRQLEGAAKAKPVVYGHGLLGSYTESERGDLGLAAADLMPCATYWVGMSDPDFGTAAATLQDINGMTSVSARLRQGVVNQLFLARLLRHADGFVAEPEMRTASGEASFDTDEVFYEGHSQGGIMGFAATAVSNEWSKAIIGVPAVNYSLIIPRSNNWQRYGPVIAGGYPDPVDSLLVLGLLQQQWDRGEGSGYVRYLLGGLPDTQDHQVIIQVALSDHQVGNAGSDLAARTAGVPVRVPQVGAGRLPWKTPSYGLDTVEAGEAAESLLVYWDAGSLPIPTGTFSPDMAPAWKAECGSDAETKPCLDPHEYPRRTPEAQEQRNTFFATGKIDDVCGADACKTVPRDRDGKPVG